MEKQKQQRMSGVVIAMVTPMKENGKIDEASLEKLAHWLDEETAVDCLYPDGTNGESLLLGEGERQQVAEIVAKTARQTTVFIQTGAMTTAETASHVRHAASIGANGAGIMTPAFFSLDAEALLDYYKAAAGAAPGEFPLYVYNIPGCTTNDVTAGTMRRIMEACPNVRGIKYSFPDLLRIEDYMMQAPRPLDVLLGCDSLFLQCLSLGGAGTVSGPAAIFHERFTRLYRQFREGDFAGAQETQRQIARTDRMIAAIPGIPGLKALLKMRGVIDCDACRAPLRPLTKEEYRTLENVFESYMKEENLNA